MDQKITLLRSVPLLAALDDADLGRIAGMCDQVDVKAGRVLAAQGTYGTEFYIVTAGRVSVERDGHHLRDLGPGGFFGELALLAKIVRTATVTAVEPTTLLVIGSREFATLLSDHASIQSAILAATAQRLARIDQDANI